MPDQLEKKLENFEWKNRSCSRHRTELKAVLLQAASKEKVSSSWLQRGWINFMYMSLSKKVLGGGLVVVVAAIIGIAGSGKLPAMAEGLKIDFGRLFSELPKSEKKVVATEYWQNLQKYVAQSKEAQDLKFIGSQTLAVVPFDAQGNHQDKEQNLKLNLWQFTTKLGEEDMGVTLGYDQQGVPQYFAYNPVNAKDFSIPTLTGTDWYKKMLSSHLTYALKASDLKMIPFSRIDYPSPEELKNLSEPHLSDGNTLFYTHSSSTSPTTSLAKYVFGSSQEENEEAVSASMVSEQTRQDIPGGNLLRFTLPNGKKIHLFVGKSGNPYFELQDLSTPFQEALQSLKNDLVQSIPNPTKNPSQFPIFVQDPIDAEHDIIIVANRQIIPKGFNGFKDINPALKFVPEQLPDTSRSILVDTVGIPDVSLEQLKKQVSGILIIKANTKTN